MINHQKISQFNIEINKYHKKIWKILLSFSSPYLVTPDWLVGLSDPTQILNQSEFLFTNIVLTVGISVPKSRDLSRIPRFWAWSPWQNFALVTSHESVIFGNSQKNGKNPLFFPKIPKFFTLFQKNSWFFRDFEVYCSWL